MSELHGPERLIINQLFDHGVFTRTITPAMPQSNIDAIQALQRPNVQKKINTFMHDLLGIGPENYQENLLFLFGLNQLNEDEVHVLLATLKAVINLPELQGRDRVVSVSTLIRLVHSEVIDLDEQIIYKLINEIFVERFALLVRDAPEYPVSEQVQEVEEYWDISPDFVYVAQCIVLHLQTSVSRLHLTELQRVNRVLLAHRFISSKTTPHLWSYLQANKNTIAQQWSQLQRFDLECGDDYALLLDRQRQPSTSKPFVIAVKIARSLGAGVPVEQLNRLIQRMIRQMFPDHSISISLVKQALFDYSLAVKQDGFITPTAIAQRFAVHIDEEDG